MAEPKDSSVHAILLEDNDGEPDTWTIDGITYLQASIHDCILDAVSEANALKELWGQVRVEPL